jgi:hypothetical protein
MSNFNCWAEYEIDGFWFFFQYLERSRPTIQVSGNVDLSDPHYMRALQKALNVIPLLEPYAELNCMLRIHRDTNFHSFNPSLFDRCADLVQFIRKIGITPQDERIQAFLFWFENQNKTQKPVQVNSKGGGFVYLLQSPTGAYKIGRAIDPEDRLRTFSVKLPFEVEYACLIRTSDMVALERELHQQFEEKRVNGEWFNLDENDVAYIKSLAS